MHKKQISCFDGSHIHTWTDLTLRRWNMCNVFSWDNILCFNSKLIPMFTYLNRWGLHGKPWTHFSRIYGADFLDIKIGFCAETMSLKCNRNLRKQNLIAHEQKAVSNICFWNAIVHKVKFIRKFWDIWCLSKSYFS